MQKTILAGLLASSLTGCAGINQAVSAYGAVAVDSAKASNDNLIAGWTVAACATPLSAIYRNPQIIPALRVLCAPRQDAAPSAILDGAAPDYRIAKP